MSAMLPPSAAPLLLGLALAGAPGLASREVFAAPLMHRWESGMHPRLQWLGNDGYCGEVSAVMAAMRFGSYLSQYDVRSIATGGNQSEYYLVGENDATTSRKLRLASHEYPNSCVPGAPRSCSEEYLAWVKRMSRKGHAVTVTVYMNNYLFYGDTDPQAGEPDYDHIVSVLSVESAHDDDDYHDDDRLTIGDHGLWSPGTPPVPQYNFTYTFREFQASRAQANAKDGNIYYTADRFKDGNFGIAHTGPLEDDPPDMTRPEKTIGGQQQQQQRWLLPVRVETNVPWERPVIADGAQARPAPMPLTLTVTVSGLEQGANYSLCAHCLRIPQCNRSSCCFA